MTVLISLGRTLTRTTTVGLRLRQRKVLSAHSIWREEREESQRVKREQTEQGESYAVISMVCAAVCSGLVELAPSGSVLVALRLRMPSVEPTLEAEWVLERTSRVIPAVGTVGWQREVCVVSDRNHQCGAVSDMCVRPGCRTAHRPTSECWFESSALWPSSWIQIWWQWVWGSVHTAAPNMFCSVWKSFPALERAKCKNCQTEASNLNLD